jgi:hypothetical protein
MTSVEACLLDRKTKTKSAVRPGKMGVGNLEGAVLMARQKSCEANQIILLLLGYNCFHVIWQLTKASTASSLTKSDMRRRN